MKSNLIESDKENYYIKKLKALKHYCPKSYKHLLFNINKNELVTVNGVYKLDLPTSNEFKFVHGQIQLEYEVKDNKVFYRDIYPLSFFEEGYKRDLTTYKNIFFRNQTDIFKIDLYIKMKGI